MKLHFGVALLTGLVATGFASTDQLNVPKADQTATCYTETNSNGFYEVYDYPESFIVGDFDNSFSSCCFLGVWMLYDDYEFNSFDFNVRKDNYKVQV